MFKNNRSALSIALDQGHRVRVFRDFNSHSQLNIRADGDDLEIDTPFLGHLPKIWLRDVRFVVNASEHGLGQRKGERLPHAYAAGQIIDKPDRDVLETDFPAYYDARQGAFLADGFEPPLASASYCRIESQGRGRIVTYHPEFRI